LDVIDCNGHDPRLHPASEGLPQNKCRIGQKSWYNLLLDYCMRLGTIRGPGEPAFEGKGVVKHVFATAGPNLEKVRAMKFVSNVRMRFVFFLIVALAPGGQSILRAALPLQDSKTATQQEPDTQAASPSPDAVAASVAPLVAYEHGQLTIVAENVRLSEILTALHAAMGTQVDLPAGASSERIWARLGPGPARKVLSQLLSNTDLNFIIQGSSVDPAGIQSVSLTPRTPDGAPGRIGLSSDPVQSVAERRLGRANPAPDPAPEQEASVSPEPPPAAPAAATTPAPTEPAATAAAAPSSTAATEPSVTLIPGPPNIAAETMLPSAGSFNPHPSPPASLTPDQMAQQLSNMYQQRRQMQQTHSGSTLN
jgi:hypothetical protein